MKKHLRLLSLLAIFLVLLSACSSAPSSQPTGSSAYPASVSASASEGGLFPPHSDLRGNYAPIVINEDEYNPDDMHTFQFDESTTFQGNEELQKAILEAGKNPGLGVRALHDRGITGKGVTVAIIDQPLIQYHPEFKGKIVAYNNVEALEAAPAETRETSMHGPAISSLLAGNTLGTAPDVQIYYVAMASWDADAAQGAEALDWLIEQNEKLDADEKIRIVSVSANFTDNVFKNQEAWADAVERASDAGMLVLDCRIGYDSCIIWPSSFNRLEPEDVTQSEIGYLYGTFSQQPANTLGAPIAYRTTAEHYWPDNPSYAYYGAGGFSWAIPYAAGVFALGWQIAPSLTADEIVEIAFDTAFVNDEGESFLYPTAFVGAIEAMA